MNDFAVVVDGFLPVVPLQLKAWFLFFGLPQAVYTVLGELSGRLI